ncbi:MAG: FHA domain-containing protein [Candidatus Saccharibacteria bacterium]
MDENKNDNLIVIELEDLDPETQAAQRVTPLSGTTELGPLKVLPGFREEMAKTKRKLFTHRVWQTALAGAIGALIGWLVMESAFPADHFNIDPYGDVLNKDWYLMAVPGGIMGLALGSIEGLSTRNWIRAIKGALITLLIGAAGGLVGGLFAEIAYLLIGFNYMGVLWIITLVRSLSWAVIGVFVGIGQAVSSGSGRKILNGVLGGMIGGALGGALFDPLSSLVPSEETRLAIALAVLGIGIGGAIGMVTEARKEAWLRVIDGFTWGKEYILNKTTTVGSSPHADITLVKDPIVANHHVTIRFQNDCYVLYDIGNSGGTMVKSRRVNKHFLQDGDIITIGRYVLMFCERSRGPINQR